MAIPKQEYYRYKCTICGLEEFFSYDDLFSDLGWDHDEADCLPVFEHDECEDGEFLPVNYPSEYD